MIGRLVEGYLESTAVRVNLPDVLQSNVHRLSVLELVLKLNTLTCHLDAHKHAEESSRQPLNHRMSFKQPLSLKTDTHTHTSISDENKVIRIAKCDVFSGACESI